VLLICNASNRQGDIAWFGEQRERLRLDVRVQDETFETALIGVQGPEAQSVLQPLCGAELEPLPGYAFLATEVADCPALLARTGYTGEDGFELMVAAQHALRLWQRLLEGPGVVACGLGARDTLRTEAAFALYGHEIDTSTNPYEARLGWVVDLDKPRFVGREALVAIRQRGVQRRLVGLKVAAGGVPRPGNPILPAGQVTSGTFSPTLRQSIALGYVPVEQAQVGSKLAIELRGRQVPAEVVKLPFVAHRSRARATM
jgi:aminomethyltransferase